LLHWWTIKRPQCLGYANDDIICNENRLYDELMSKYV